MATTRQAFTVLSRMLNGGTLRYKQHFSPARGMYAIYTIVGPGRKKQAVVPTGVIRLLIDRKLITRGHVDGTVVPKIALPVK